VSAAATAYQAALFNLLGILQLPGTLGYGYGYGYGKNYHRSCRKSTVDYSKVADCSYNPVENLYKFTTKDIHNISDIDLANYQGKVSLVVNVATY